MENRENQIKSLEKDIADTNYDLNVNPANNKEDRERLREHIKALEDR